MLDLRDRYRLGQGFRQRPHKRLHRRKAFWLIANELAVARDRGLQRRHSAERGALALSQARFRLRHVGARHFADREPVAGLAELLFQHIDVVTVEVENGRVLEHVHIGGDARKKGVLLGVAQLLPRSEDLQLRLTDGVERAVAVEDGLVGGDSVAPRKEIDHCAAGGGGIRAKQTGLGAFGGYIGRSGDGRQVARVRYRDGFVSHPDRGALGVDVGIGQIGLDERAADRVRVARSGADRRQTSRRKQRPAKEASRFRAASRGEPLPNCP